MTLTRRRLLTIGAVAAATVLTGSGRVAETHVWTGTALGADISIRLCDGDRERAARAVDEARALIARIEAEFSLYDPHSALSRLNRTGRLSMSEDFSALVRICAEAHAATEGLFDPTIQPIWASLAAGEGPEAAYLSTGFDRIRRDGRDLQIENGMALTFNGIAQGYATDRVSDLLQGFGYTKALINIGEYRAIGGPFVLQEAGPIGRHPILRDWSDIAVATSETDALKIGRGGRFSHILHPKGRQSRQPHTVTVSAATAAMADAFSTAIAIAEPHEVQRIAMHAKIHSLTIDGKRYLTRSDFKPSEAT